METMRAIRGQTRNDLKDGPWAVFSPRHIPKAQLHPVLCAGAKEGVGSSLHTRTKIPRRCWGWKLAQEIDSERVLLAVSRMSFHDWINRSIVDESGLCSAGMGRALDQITSCRTP